MQRKDYIDILSAYEGSKQDLDLSLKKKGIKVDIGEIGEYEKSVLQGYKGSRFQFIKKEEHSEDVRFLDIEQRIVEIEDQLIGNENTLSEGIEQIKRLFISFRKKVTKEIGDINRIYDDLKKSIEQGGKGFLEALKEKTESTYKEIEKLTKDFLEIEKKMDDKSDKDHTHKEIVELGIGVGMFNTKLENKISKDDVISILSDYPTKKEVYTKKETYNRKEIEGMISRKGSTVIAGGGASFMGDLQDVKLTDLQDGDVPKWNATNQRFENGQGGSSGSKLLTLVGQSFTVTYNGSNQALTQTYDDGTVTTNTYTGGVVTQTVTVFPDATTITATYTYTSGKVTAVAFS